MLDPTTVFVFVAAAAFVALVLFLASLAVAGVRRSRAIRVGPRLTAVVTVLGGITIGTMLLVAGDIVVALPLLGAIVVLLGLLLRRGRLRAEVAIAVAEVRRRMAEGVDPVEAGAPLREVRGRLGRRADGQLGRAMRGRLQRTLLLVGGVFAGITLVLGLLLPAA